MTIPGKEWLLGGGGPDLSLKSRVSSTKHGRRSVAAYIDRLRFYERTLDHEDIAAECSSMAFPGLHQFQVSFGCRNCHYSEALQICATKSYPSSSSSLSDHHVCTSTELQHRGQLIIAQSMGWVDMSNGNVWGIGGAALPDPSITATALCCRRT
mmetsp:Transcript_26602/g.43083  ORF Transcript_26602/g.43083 Transcript_26602/m.43083 type:complete len:154 (+) Transcript_26602:192-653(+)